MLAQRANKRYLLLKILIFQSGVSKLFNENVKNIATIESNTNINVRNSASGIFILSPMKYTTVRDMPLTMLNIITRARILDVTIRCTANARGSRRIAPLSLGSKANEKIHKSFVHYVCPKNLRGQRGSGAPTASAPTIRNTSVKLVEEIRDYF